uniref:Aspartyl/asparaginy/proline hydroxylase domain-containing protein n=1 Tax=viral metagenome TaxID=1070528 RepID=A0A6C0EB94_9ZZZZ
MDKSFYTADEISPKLKLINENKSKIINEALKIDTGWIDWVEKYLYASDGKWTVYPIFIFGEWDKQALKECPYTVNFLKQLSGLKLAILSKLSSKMKLNPHRGWKNHSNNVIRCHYGLKVPEGCYVSIRDKNEELIKYHMAEEWLCFDDSKEHYAENTSDDDRIVLIVDIERPYYISKGTSTVEDSKELIEVINYFRKRNI